MIYIENTSTNPYFNFALEYYLIKEKKLASDRIFIFWRTEPTVMIGKYQNTIEEINEQVVKELNIHVVRRITGGGTIYTDMGGWQFSFITKGTASSIDFNKYISPIITALGKVGIDAKFNSRNDLAINGKKISGNAQRMLRDYTLHHGSLLFDTNLEQMVKCLTVSDHKIVSKGIKSVRERVTNISEHLQEPLDTLEFKQLMVENIMQGSNKEYLLTKEDISRINEIASEKFESWQWNYGESPRFNITKIGILPSGKIEFKLFINKGIIDACNIYGDFFGSVDTAEFSQDLLGRQYNAQSVLPVLKKYEQTNSFYNIKALDLLEIII